MHFLERKGKEKRGQCNRYPGVTTVSLRRVRALVWGEKEREGWSMFMAFHVEEYQKEKGKSRVSDIRRGDHKHKGIYIQIFKHS